MKKIIKVILKFISALLLLSLIVSLLVYLFIDVNHYKDDIALLVEQQSGLRLEMHDELKLTIFSGVNFTTTNVKLLRGDELIADIKSINIGLAAYALYQGKIDISSVSLSLKSLNLARDKKGQFNFLPLITIGDKKSLTSDVGHNDKVLPIASLAIRNIQLAVDYFQYLDDLSSTSVRLKDSHISLSLLPIIAQHELVIDDPRLLVNYHYKGNIAIAQVLVNQFQISDLNMEFSDDQGDFVAENLAFKFIQEGKNHAAPPVSFSARGQLAFKVRYRIPTMPLEALWSQAEIIAVDSFAFNVDNLQWLDKQYQLEIDHSQLSFTQLELFKQQRSLFKRLWVDALHAKSDTIKLSLNNSKSYQFNDVALELKHVPIANKLSVDKNFALFTERFAKRSSMNLAIKNTQYLTHNIEHMEFKAQGQKHEIELSFEVSKLLKSSIIANAVLRLPEKKKHQQGQWQLKARSDNGDLKTFADILNIDFNISGLSSLQLNANGQYSQLNFKLKKLSLKSWAEEVILTGFNIDKTLNEFQNSQSVGLLDVGAVVLLGPGGILLTKGNDYNNLINAVRTDEDISLIKQLSLQVSMDNDMLNMDDVAFATEQHRLAVKGKIDIKKETFVDFSIATVDKQGCVLYQEQVKGSLLRPKIKKVNVLVKSVVNPINSLLNKVTQPLKLNCQQVFYNGDVQQISQSKQQQK